MFEDNSNSTEYRTNENLNENSSTNENSKEDEKSSRSNGPSKEGEESKEDKDPSDENSRPDENSKEDEMDCSVFGDSNSTDEDKDKDNDKWYESSRSSKSDNHENGMFTNLISELTNNNPKANEIPNNENPENNNSKSENMKKTKISTNTIPSEAKNPSDENSKANENLNAFGKLQSFRDLKTGRIDGYQFNSYDNLNDSRDYSKSFHASVLCLNLEPSDLKKVSVPDTGTWGILNRTNGVYSFIPSILGPSYAPNNAPQASKTADVDNHTTDTEKIDSTQSPIANKASNAYADDLEDDAETIAMREKVMKQNFPKMASDIIPKGREYFKGALDRWKELHLKCAYADGNYGVVLTIEEAIEKYSSYESPQHHLDAIRTYADEICTRMRQVLAANVITQEQFKDFSNVFYSKSEAYKKACAEEFKKNKPTTESEKWMYNWIYKKNKKNVKN